MTIENINGKRLNVWSAGISSDGSLDKPLVHNALTMVFVHGLGSSQNFFYGLLPSLISKCNAILMDNVGSAQSPPTDPGPTLDSIVADVNAVMDFFGIKDNVILVGHSIGGMIAVRSAELDTSGRIKKLVLVGPLHPRVEATEMFSARIALVEKEQTLLGVADFMPHSATGSKATGVQKAFIRALLAQQPPQGYIGLCKVIASSTPPGYSNVKIPALILVGKDDKNTPYEGCVKVIEENLGGEVKVDFYEGVGHWHCIEVPDQVISSILAFI